MKNIFVKMPIAIFLSEHRVSPAAFLLYAALRFRTNPKRDKVDVHSAIDAQRDASVYMSWPALSTLIEDTGMSKSTIIRATAELEASKWLRVWRGKSIHDHLSTHRSNTYQLAPQSPGVFWDVD